jgi:type I restriction enzyme, S subunit
VTRWRTALLGEFCEVRIGRTPRRDTPAYWGGCNPWATVGELDGGLISETKEHITDLAVQRVMPAPVDPGTLLFSFKLSIGKMAVAGRRLHHNEAIAALPIKRRDLVTPEFLYFAMKSATHETGANHAVLGKVLNKAKVSAIQVPVPPLDEQRRIVDILNHAASIRRLREQAKAKTKELIPALFLDMFGDPVTNPKQWPIERIDRLYERKPNYGTMIRPSAESNAWLDIRVANIQGGRLDLSDRKYVDLPRSDADRHSLRDGDLILARAIGSREHLGKCVVVCPGKERWAFDSHLMRVRFDRSRVQPKFASALLSHFRGRSLFLRRVRQSAVQFNINTREFGSIELPLPPLELQDDFAERVADIQATIDQMDRAAAAAEQLQAALMARLFDGG